MEIKNAAFNSSPDDAIRPRYSALMTGVSLVAVLASLLGCPSKSGGNSLASPEAQPQVAQEVPKPTPPLGSAVILEAAPKVRARSWSSKAPSKHLAPAPAAVLPAALVPAPAPVTQAQVSLSAPAPTHPAAVVPPQVAPVSPPSPAPPAPPATPASLKAEAKAKAAYRRLEASYGAQMALASPTNGGLRLAASGPSAALGLHLVLDLPKAPRVRFRLDYTVFPGATRTNTAPPLPQTLDTRISSLALGADLLLPLGSRWSLGLAVSELRWSVASTNTLTPTLGGSMTRSGTAHWTRLGYGPVLTCKVSEHLEIEGRLLNSHYGYENQPANTATVGLLWRF